MKKVYKSKIGLEIIIPILIILAFGFKNIINEPKVAPIILLILVLAFITFLLTSIKYTIENQNLNIKAGFLINQNINIMNIESIKKSEAVTDFHAITECMVIFKITQFSLTCFCSCIT